MEILIIANRIKIVTSNTTTSNLRLCDRIRTQTGCLVFKTRPHSSMWILGRSRTRTKHESYYTL